MLDSPTREVNRHGFCHPAPRAQPAHFLPAPGPCGRLDTSLSGPLPLNTYFTLGTSVLLLVLLVFGGFFWASRRRQMQRSASLQKLLDLADLLEADLKTCRAGLKQAHAVMSINPDLPAASEQDARHAIDAGLRGLLQQRLWIRDHAQHSDQHELDEAAASMHSTRERLQPLMLALKQAQNDLDSAMNEHIRRDSDA